MKKLGEVFNDYESGGTIRCAEIEKVTLRKKSKALELKITSNQYIEIKEIPSFAFCAKTREKALENYKKQLRLSLMLMLEDGEHIVEPGEETEDDIDWESICP